MAIERISVAQCNTLAGADPTKDAEFAVFNQENSDGLTINYSGGDVCVDDKKFTFSIDILCDASVTG